jgi:Coenzyme PQQ synthesis protein D (PqqD)
MEGRLLFPYFDFANMTRVAIPETVLFRELEGEAVLLATESGKYFGLNEVGTRIWTLLQRHGGIEPALQELLQEYQVAEDQLHEDLLCFVELLASRRLLEIRT